MKKLLIPVFVAAVFFTACSKNDAGFDEPVGSDTLSTGWTRLNSPEYIINDAAFVSATTGFAVSPTKIYRTTDAGQTWTTVYSSSLGFINISVGSANDIIFCTTYGGMVATHDGGNNFVEVPQVAKDAQFLTETTVYALGSQLLKSTDAGRSWTQVNLPAGATNDVYRTLFFLDEQTGFIGGGKWLYKTTDGGQNWQASTLDFSLESLHSLYITADGTSYLGDQIALAKSTAGSNSWKRLASFPGAFTDVHFLSPEIGYFTLGKYIIRTSDGGANFSKAVTVPANQVITEIHFLDATHAFASGQGVLLKYAP